MPANLPVPSKGALRALRNLALGTSCTVAVGAGLLTEDRRRRIHTARQVYDNARTLKSLKSSRHYHAAGVLEQFEEHAVGQSEDAFWLPSNVAKSKSIAVPHSLVVEDAPQSRPVSKSFKKPSIPVPPAISNGPTSSRSHLGSLTPLKASAGSSTFLTHGGSGESFRNEPSSRPDTLRGIFARQQKLASDIATLLQPDSSPNVELAISKFLDAFREGVKVTKKGMIPALVDAAITLFHAVPKNSHIQEQILLIVARHGPIDEVQFQKFSPTHTMSRMFSRVRGKEQKIDAILLEAVTSIYLTPFISEPLMVTDLNHQLGEKLCATTCEAGLYFLTEKVFTRMESTRGDRPLRCVKHLMEAVHAWRKPQKNFRYFKLLYTQTSPDQTEFFKVGSMVLDTLLKKDPSKLEEFLDLVTKMAESNAIQMSTTWFLRILGQSWRTNQDITATRALFERMVPQISHTAHPQAVFSAIIQFCIEAGLELEAMEYYARLCKVYPASSKDIRILGHLAYAKALRGDWAGVGNDLQTIHDSNPARKGGEQTEFSAIVTPIFKSYVKSHTVSETEDFIRVAVDEWQLRITPQISNIMVGVYTESKEIESLLRWIELAASVGCPMYAGTINVLFRTLARDRNFAFLEINRLHHRICKLDDKLGTRSTDADTLILLQNIAISRSRTDDEARQNLSRLVPLNPDTCGPRFEFGSGKIYWDMIRAYSKEQLGTVVQIYKDSQAGPVKLGSKHILLAVKATLKLTGGSLTEAAALIKSAQDDGHNVVDSVSKLMIYRIEMLDENQADAEDIADMVQNDIKALNARGIVVPDTILTHAMSVLVRHGRYRRAIDVWQNMSVIDRKLKSPDLVTLTVLLEAYIGLRFNDGIRWVMQSLVDNKISPDLKFQSVLLNERRRVDQSSVWRVDNKSRNYGACVKKACHLVRENRFALREEKTEVKYKIMKLMEDAAMMASGSTRRVQTAKEDAGFRWKPIGIAVAAGGG